MKITYKRGNGHESIECKAETAADERALTRQVLAAADAERATAGYSMNPVAVERDRYRAALEKIREFPRKYGNFDLVDAATAMAAIAKEALKP